MRKNSEAPRIVIAGYYGLGNAGDEAILSGMVRDLRAEVPGADLRVLSLNPDRVHALHGIRAESLRDLPGIIEAIRESDLVILGGGGLLHDYWPLDESQLLTPAHQGLALYLGVPLLAEMLGRPYMLYGLGVGPIRHATSIPLMKTVLDGAERITVRDEISREAIQAVMGEGVDIRHRVEVTADPAFNMRWELASEGTSRKAPMIGKSGPRLGVNLRFWDFGVNPGDWEREVARGLDRWIGEQGGEVLFIPLQGEGGHRHENDRAICERVRSEMRDPSRAIMLDPGNAFHNLPGILSQCDVVMSMRMHGILFSLLVGVAGLGLAYDPKVEALLARMGMNEYALPPDQWKADAIAAKLMDLRSLDASQRIDIFVRQMQTKARENAVIASRLICKEKEPLRMLEVGIRQIALRKVLQTLELQKELEAKMRQEKALQSEIETYQQMLRDQAARIDALHEHLHRQRRESEKAMAAMRRGLNASKQEWQAALQRLEEHRDELILERDSLQRQLSELRSTIAVRLMAKYWEWARRAFPMGSRRRRLYALARRGLGRLARPGATRWGVRARPHAKGKGAEGAQDDASPPLRGSLPITKETLSGLVEEAIGEGRRKALLILSPTPYDLSEGQRSIHLAREFSWQGFLVALIYWEWHPDSGAGIRMPDEGIVEIPLDTFLAAPEPIMSALEGLEECVLLMEFPYPGFFEVLALAHAAGWIVLYDVVDDWKGFHAVGQAPWYDEAFERHLLVSADAVLAVNSYLVHRAAVMGRSDVWLVPNGFDKAFAEVDQPRSLERGEITLGYFGYLSPAWFDWSLVKKTAADNPSWRIYLIGYGDDGHASELPANIRFLGKKPRTSLASYAQNWDVGMIPFKEGRVSQGADPIKCYEYLGLGLPVVATGVTPPDGAAAFVFQAEGPEDFAAKVRLAKKASAENRDQRIAFSKECLWSARVEEILGVLQRSESRIAEKRELFKGR